MRNHHTPTLPRAAIKTSTAVDTLRRVQSELETDSRLAGAGRDLRLSVVDGIVTVEGLVDEIASKVRAIEDVGSMPEVLRVVDRVQVRPSAQMEDGEIRDHVRDALVIEEEFRECGVSVACDGKDEVAQAPLVARGSIRARVERGVVTLEGEVPSWSHRRLAGVLVWWVPGTRDVENRLCVSPPEFDSDDEITDAVRIALEREPLVDADQVQLSTRDGRVTLMGALRSEEQRAIVERDAWFVLGVKDVANEIALVS